MSNKERQRRYSFPLLSPTFQSHQLWTPLHLDRITIGEPHYHGYLEKNVQKEQPHLNLVSRRVQKFGDNGFFLHKDIPVEQLYNRTALKRSDVRPWDDIMPRPLTSPQVVNSESHLPYPKNHPFSSHISQFAVFPNTQSDYREVDLSSQQPTAERNDQKEFNHLRVFTAETSTQTDHNVDSFGSKAPYQTVIQQKAFSSGMRIEDVSFSSQKLPIIENKPGMYWHIPRTHTASLHHQRSLTYPAPRTMFCSNAGTGSLCRPLTVNTHQTLLAVNQQMTQRTTYKDQFPSSASNSSQCNSLVTTRCHSAVDHRGKYSRKVNFSSSLPPQQQHLPSTADAISQEMLFEQLVDASAHTQQPCCIMVDKATQTDDTDVEEIDKEENDLEWLLPVALKTTEVDEKPAACRSPSLESFLYSEISRPASAPVGYYTSTALRPFSRKEARDKFYFEHPEALPDLREMATRAGKRHTFSGFHAHYWH